MYRKVILAALVAGILALAVGIGRGAVPDWPEQVPVGSLLVLDAPGDVACAWSVSAIGSDEQPYEPVWREFTQPHAIVVETKAGILTIDLQTSATRGLRKISWSILVGEGADPTPDPNPAPPQPTKIFAVIVYEEHDRDDYTPEQIGAIDSLAVREYMKGHGYSFRSVDKDVVDGDGKVPASIASFLQRAKAQTLPRIIVADENGEVLIDKEVATEAGVLADLKKHGGE